MLLENLLRGMTIPGEVPQDRSENMRKQLLSEEKSLFVTKNLIGEIVRFQKKLVEIKGVKLPSSIIEHAHSIEQTAIERAWGVNRIVFTQF